jgi:hypothetical protein
VSQAPGSGLFSGCDLDHCRQQAVTAFDLSARSPPASRSLDMTMPEPIEDVEHSFVTGRDLRPWLGDDLLANSVMQDARGPGFSA